MSKPTLSSGQWWAGPLQSRRDREAAGALYLRTFGYESEELRVNPYMLSALQRVGGSAIGVKDAAGELVGFAYGFHAVDERGLPFHYSQAAVVDPSRQGHGTGELLKYAQRDFVVSRTGVERMRWAFSPCLARNAHFNLSKLGAAAIDYVPDYYDEADSDRLVVEWVFAGDDYREQRELAGLLAPTLAGVLAPDVGGIVTLDESSIPGARWIVFPRAQTAATKEALKAELRDSFAGDAVLCWSAAIDDTSACYFAVPRSEVSRAV